MKSFIAFDVNKIYTSRLLPDHNPTDEKLLLLLELTHEIGKFGYVLSQEALEYLDESDIQAYFKDIVPVLYSIHYHRNYTENSDLGNLEKYLKDWKSRRREPWIDNFYLSGDFRFISESAKSLNLPITYLDRLSDLGLYEIYKNLCEQDTEPTQSDIVLMKYLSGIYKKDHDIVPGNKIGKLVLGFYDSSIRPERWSDYKLLNPTRRERRLILEKLESLDDLKNESAKDLKELLTILHPADYKKLFPKVWKYWTDLMETQDIQEAHELIESGRTEEFTERFIGFLYSKKSDESDLMTLLYSPKLKPIDLLDIMGRLEKYEIGVPRYYGSGYVVNNSSVVSIIPAIKEFIISRLETLLKDPTLPEISEELREYDFPEIEPRKCKPLMISRINKLGNIRFSVEWPKETCYYSELKTYLWKGRGKVIKKLRDFTWAERKDTEEVFGNIDLKDAWNKGFRYLIFNNIVYKHAKGTEVELKVGDITTGPIKANVRNNFGGLIDLETSEVWILKCDLSEIPMYNGNIPEAIIRYILPEFRFSAYDFMSIVGGGGYNDYFEKLQQLI